MGGSDGKIFGSRFDRANPHHSARFSIVSTVRVGEFSLSYGLPTKLRAGPYGSYDKSTLARPAGSTRSRPDNQSMRERCC